MKRTRRQFLAAGLAGAGAAAAAALPVAGARSGGSASAAPPPAVDRFVHRGRQIALSHMGDTPLLQVDGRTMPPHVLSSIRVGGQLRYTSHLLPFRDEPDARRLVRELIDGEELDLFRL
ncbi:MAG TPA: hypothetical protein VNT51_14185 [Miltoncostaeaceae bacterium]|nr:hypothetical protein [Miltoncostaeaceae bacterium]